VAALIENGGCAVLLVTVAVGMTMGAMASFPLLRWGRRLDRRRVAAIESRVSPWLAALFLALAVWMLSPGYPLWRMGPMIQTAGYVALAAALMVRHSGISRWRAALYGAATVILFALLGDNGVGPV
jgi:hypothetical protein